MTKGCYILQTLITQRKLRYLCRLCGEERMHAFARSVALRNRPPSYKLMNLFKAYIPAQFWFEPADELFKESITIQKKTLLPPEPPRPRKPRKDKLL